MTQVTVYIHVLDQSNNPVSCRVKIPGATAPDTRSTGSDGIAAFHLEQGVWYVASVLPIDGYTLSENSSASLQAAAIDITLHVTKGEAPSKGGILDQISSASGISKKTLILISIGILVFYILRR